MILILNCSDFITLVATVARMFYMFKVFIFSSLNTSILHPVRGKCLPRVS